MIMGQQLKQVCWSIGSIILLLVLWQFLAVNDWIKKEYTSYPSAIFNDLISFYQTGGLLGHLFATLYEAFAGLLLGTLFGVVVAVVLGNMKSLGAVLAPAIVVINSIPQLALAPIYIMWFGIGYGSKIFMASLLVFFLVFFATYGGIKSTEKQLHEAAQLLGANNFTILVEITLPTIAPWIVAGVKAGIGASLIGAIVGEYLGATKGIGWTISFATSYFDMARVMSCLVLLLILGYLCNKGLTLIENKLMKYRNR